MQGIEAYPLCWPEGWPRMAPGKREHSRFGQTQDQAQHSLMEEIRRLGGRQPILSTNIRLRQDGLPYASQRTPEDPGVAVYFTLKKNPMVFACDRWKLVKDNIISIQKTIEALRGIERWGASDMLERAFTGFTALPNLDAVESWRDVLDCQYCLDIEAVREQYLKLRSRYHPDKPTGDATRFREVQNAWEQAQAELG